MSNKMYQLDFNTGKCEVIRIGQEKGRIGYFVNGERLEAVEGQRDLENFVD